MRVLICNGNVRIELKHNYAVSYIPPISYVAIWSLETGSSHVLDSPLSIYREVEVNY